MRLQLTHNTHYNYSQAQRYIVQSHRLYPAMCQSQYVLSWEVTCESAVFGNYFSDGAGDRIRTMTVNERVSELDITVNAVVDTVDLAGVERVSREIVVPQVYLQSTPLTEPDTALISAAGAIDFVTEKDELSKAHKLMHFVAETVEYEKGSTHHEYTAAQAFQQKQGVCQDQAHCLIVLARLNNLPARYVTGYFFDAGSDLFDNATHAWAEIYIKDLGWVGFDVSNRCCPDERYIRVGSGPDADYAAPIKGVSRGVGEENLKVSVQLSQQQ